MQDKNLDKIRKKSEEIYHDINSVYCPYFEEEIIFNSKGLRHIKFKNRYTARNRSDQYMRFKNIQFAPIILEKSSTLQEYKVISTLVKVKRGHKKEILLKKTKFYGFIAIIDDNGFTKRLKIIIKEVEGGKKHFWSIVPFWKSNKELKIHSGDPETE